MPTVRIPRVCSVFPQLGVIQGQIPRQRVDRRRGARSATRPRALLHFIDQGHHIAGIAGIPDRQLKGEDEARGGLGDNPRFAAKLGRAVALAFANGGDRGIVGIDNFALAQGLPWVRRRDWVVIVDGRQGPR